MISGGTPGMTLSTGLFSGGLFLNTYRAVARLLTWTTLDDIESFAQEQQTEFLRLRVVSESR